MAKMNAAKVSEFNGLQGIFEFIRLIAKSVDSKRLGEHLRWLGTEADDPKVRKKVASYFAETRSIFRRLVEEAVANHEMKVMDPEDLAMTLEALLQGSIFQFGFLNEKNIERHLLNRFRSVLQPFTTN
ncbi:TetR family transcriptional regulator C-terminal domain-containing protein [Bdellovibrio bacteriovorus]|uniref:TetR family transcriptional regulator C-terminal domain-containing protein n=1 Tax=Bdellovibrio TaxID=958 RepID=UPI0035A92E48